MNPNPQKKKIKINRAGQAQVPNEIVETASLDILKQLKDKIRKKGAFTNQSMHEIYGLIAEEFNREYLLAMHNNDLDGCEEELVDIAVAAIWGLASLRFLRKEGVYNENNKN